MATQDTILFWPNSLVQSWQVLTWADLARSKPGQASQAGLSKAQAGWNDCSRVLQPAAPSVSKSTVQLQILSGFWMVMLRGARACSGGALVEVWRCSVDSVDRKKEGEVRQGTLLHRKVEVQYRTCVPVLRARTSHHHGLVPRWAQGTQVLSDLA